MFAFHTRASLCLCLGRLGGAAVGQQRLAVRVSEQGAAGRPSSTLCACSGSQALPAAVSGWTQACQVVNNKDWSSFQVWGGRLFMCSARPICCLCKFASLPTPPTTTCSPQVVNLCALLGTHTTTALTFRPLKDVGSNVVLELSLSRYF